jgi:hypothetical protein
MPLSCSTKYLIKGTNNLITKGINLKTHIAQRRTISCERRIFSK